MDNVKRNPDISVDDLSSEFDYQSELERKKRRKDVVEELQTKEKKPGRGEAKDVFHDEHGKMFRRMSRLMTMDAYSRHKEMINLYFLNRPGASELFKRDTSHDKTDYDVLKDNHKFLWSAEDEQKTTSSWEARMAKKYYDKLFKEYCIVDLSFYQKNKIAMRWRIEKEVTSGKGQFICGNKKCDQREDLCSWEVNFAYVEQGERKNALVKVRLCPDCSEKLNYGSKKKKYVKVKKSSRFKLPEKNSDKADKKKNDCDVTEGKVKEEPAEEGDQPSTSNQGEEVWQKPVVIEGDRTVDDDIDDFLNDIFD